MFRIQHNSFSDKTEVLNHILKDELEMVEEVLCIALLLGYSVEFIRNRYVYHYEYGFSFTTSHQRFYLTFKLKSNGGIDYAILIKKGTIGIAKTICSSQNELTSILEVIQTVKYYL